MKPTTKWDVILLEIDQPAGYTGGGGGGCTPQTVFIPGRHSRVWRFAQVSSNFRLEIFGQKGPDLRPDLMAVLFFTQPQPKSLHADRQFLALTIFRATFLSIFCRRIFYTILYTFSVARHFQCHHHQVCGVSVHKFWCRRCWWYKDSQNKLLCSYRV